jgi:hypothetical protein
MAFISFVYSIKGSGIYYVGKIVEEYLSDGHEGLDLLVKQRLVVGLNKFFSAQKRSSGKPYKPLKGRDLHVGVTGFSSNYDRVPAYSSSASREAKAFDFYFDGTPEYSGETSSSGSEDSLGKEPERCEKFFVNGKMLEM